MPNTIEKTWEPHAANTPVGPLDFEFRPGLVPGVSFVVDKDSVQAIQIIETPRLDPSMMATEAVIPVDGERREKLTRLRAFFDGTHTIREIATACDWNRDDCARFIQELYEQAITRDVAARPVPPLSFYRHIVALGRQETVRALSESPLVECMLSGNLTKRLIVGYLVEEYHLVASASSHISAALTTAPTQRLRMMFSDYLSGEYWHCLLLERGLLAAGLGAEELAASDPLPGTLAVINLMRHSARTDLLAYSACLSVNEGGDARAAVAFSKMYDLLGTLVAPEVLAASREHAELDFEDQHETLGAEPFAEETILGGPRQDAIYRIVMAATRTQLEQHRQIAAFYGIPNGPLAHSYAGADSHSSVLRG